MYTVAIHMTCNPEPPPSSFSLLYVFIFGLRRHGNHNSMLELCSLCAKPKEGHALRRVTRELDRTCNMKQVPTYTYTRSEAMRAGFEGGGECRPAPPGAGPDTLHTHAETRRDPGHTRRRGLSHSCLAQRGSTQAARVSARGATAGASGSRARWRLENKNVNFEAPNVQLVLN